MPFLGGWLMVARTRFAAVNDAAGDVDPALLNL
jgi:hypothetical protein